MNEEIKLYSMKQACNKTNLTYDTLKFYCNKVLVPNVKRNKNNYRVFDEHDIAWINSLSCLKNCGMSIIEMKEYLKLCLKGESSIPERKDILDAKLNELEHKKQEIQESIDYIHWKQKFYNDVLSGKIEYYSNLIKKDDKNHLFFYITIYQFKTIMVPKEVIDSSPSLYLIYALLSIISKPIIL